jgi:hypothetical protein
VKSQFERNSPGYHEGKVLQAERIGNTTT